MLQNRIGELFSIIKFLKVVPYSFYYCKKCECKSHSWMFEPGHSRGRKCLQCDHTAMSHFAWWNKNVMNPIGKYGNKFVCRSELLTTRYESRQKQESDQSLKVYSHPTYVKKNESGESPRYVFTSTYYHCTQRSSNLPQNLEYLFHSLMHWKMISMKHFTLNPRPLSMILWNKELF
jgi:hypothetical protein